MIPPQVYIIAAQAIMVWIASRRNTAREFIEENLVNHFGGWDQFGKALTQYCPGVYLGDPSTCEGDRLWIEITQEVGRQDLAHAQDVLRRTAEFFQRQAELAPYAEPCLEQMQRETPNIGPALDCLRSAPDRLAAAQLLGSGGISGVVNSKIGGVPIWIIVAAGAVLLLVVWRK